MNVSNLIKRSPVVMVALAAGQILGAASGEGRRIDTFSTDSQEVPSVIGLLQISYLPNSKLDRLRVFFPQNDRPVVRPDTGPSCEYDEMINPIAVDPIKTVVIAQILNANPFSADYEASLSPERAKYKYFIVEKWLRKCVKETGLDELAVGQASDLCTVNEQNEKNLREACNNLTILEGFTERPIPSEGVEYLLAEMFGEISSPTSGELKARHISHRGVCNLQ